MHQIFHVICGDFLKNFTFKGTDSENKPIQTPYTIEFSLILNAPVLLFKYILLLLFINLNLIFEKIMIFPLRFLLDLLLGPFYK